MVWLGELSNSEPINKTVGGVKENTAADYYKPTDVSNEYRDAKQPGKPETPKGKEQQQQQQQQKSIRRQCN